MTTSDWEMTFQVEVPAGPTRLRTLLPLVQSLTDAVVAAAEQADLGKGHSISCRKGCGACCRQLVPVTQTEARHLRDLVEALPEPRRSQVRKRFADARQRLEESGLFDRLLQSAAWTSATFLELATAYFQLGLACPFLEDEACSIHPIRPLKCREFLVTTPAENCSRPTPQSVRSVPLPVSVAAALARLDVPSTAPCYERWLPLTLAPDWAEQNPDEGCLRPGPELLGDFLAQLKVTPSPPTPQGEGRKMSHV
ncbi:MAG: YkgJ family cysteine cluster protein [Gemmataceae bacterium]|nr:YkgJ family cysteine cluster protein [Gemmataceae bacterium]MCI0743063.1 YkgJ family cysteine cluster protein [Gemmataceae bacterium]